MSSIYKTNISCLVTGILFYSVISLYASPVLIDFNEASRTESETNEPGWNPWPTGDVASESKTFDGITFKVTKNSSAGSSLTTEWYKAGIQSPNYARLVCDGLTVKDGNSGASVKLEISGLSTGIHTLLSYHNGVDGYQLAEMNIDVDGVRKVTNIKPTNRALRTDSAALSYISFNATAGNTVTILYSSNTSSGSNYKNVIINALVLDLPNPRTQATIISPAHRDMHANADDGSIQLLWKAASGVKSHQVYFGIDSTAVAVATVSSPEYKGTQSLTTWKADNLSNLRTYWWRIDEIDTNNVTTPGNVWSFSPRHPAFPGAEGYGRFARGGRGGKVVHVTNLNDDGPGSLREAVTKDIGPRTIVFDVGGTITLKSRLTLSNSFVTIAGQTSPGMGICIRSAPFGFSGVNDGIMRFVKIRLGYGTTYDGTGLQGSNHCIFDHLSVSWTIDEAFSSRSAKNITLQRTMLAEALNQADHVNYPSGTKHGYAATIGGDTGSYHHNLLAHNEGRNWSLGGGLDGNNYYAGRLDIFNNIVYNWHERATDGGAHEVNFVNNYYKKGAATSLDLILNAQLEGAGLGSQSYYYSGNILQSQSGSFNCDGKNSSCGRKYTLSNNQVLNWNVWAGSPFFGSFAKIHSANDAFKNVLSDVGMNMPLFDEHDKRIVKETLNGTYTFKGSKTGLPGLPDRESDVGGYESYPSVSQPAGFDSDGDGLPDWWEAAKGLSNKNVSGDFSESNADPDGDGFTNLEDYLNWMATPHVTVAVGKTITFNLAELSRGFNLSPVWNVEKMNGMNLSIKDSILTITPTSVTGIVYVKFTVADKENSSMERTLGIFAEGSVNSHSVTIRPHKASPQWRFNNRTVQFRSEIDGNLFLYGLTGKQYQSLKINAGTWYSIPQRHLVSIAVFSGEGIRFCQVLNSAIRL